MLRYIYFRVYNFYSKWGDRTPDVLSIAVITVTQCCNVLTLLILLNYMKILDVELSYWVILPVGVIYTANYYFLTSSYEQSSLKWRHEEPTIRDLKGVGIWIYVIISVALPFYFASNSL